MKMSKLTPQKSSFRTRHKRADEIKETTNFEGGKSYTLPAKERLATRVMTSTLNEKQFYGDGGTQEIVDDLKEVSVTDPLFVLKLAAYTRNVMFLRSVPNFVLAYASLIPDAKPFVRAWAPKIVKRADEPAEVIAAIDKIFCDEGKKPVIPNCIKKGVGDALKNFDIYQLMKYKGSGNTVNLWDLFNVCHPKPENDEQATLWKKFMNNELKSAKTWETTLSKAGQEGTSKKEAWEDIIPEMGYMALLRNLRNFIEEDISDEIISLVVNKLTNEKAVRGSKQFPFRFFSAYRELTTESNQSFFHGYREPKIFDSKGNAIVDAVEKALEISVNNVDTLPGRTAIFTDHSGSMEDVVSEKSSISRAEVGFVLSAIADKICEQPMNILFGQTIKSVDSRGLSMMRYIEHMKDIDVGHSTNGYKCFQHLIKNKIKVDRVILLSDMQLYYGGRDISTDTSHAMNSFYNYGEDVTPLWDKYRSEINPNAFLHSVDLAGYGTSVNPLTQKGVCLHAGWNSKFLESIPKYEKTASDLVKEIEAYE